MKVVLLKDVKGSGKAGDVIEAKDGFARNYLIKNGLAKAADAAALNENRAQKEAEKYHKEQLLKANRELREKLDGKQITVQVKSGESGKFFGAVTGKEIAEKLAEMGFDIDKKKIQLQSNIKVAGVYPVTVRISAEETAKITVNIIN
ncbi:MAG: 50S ribosomal protein L9 [Clostridia bacterium]|jgi:large subunit ribosomal protein L9|nr:50S ribosomal protein L9 [Clostridia bacterium]